MKQMLQEKDSELEKLKKALEESVQHGVENDAVNEKIQELEAKLKSANEEKEKMNARWKRRRSWKRS